MRPLLTGLCPVVSGPDLPEPVHARAVAGGLVPQPPAGSGSALAAGHRLPDGPPAEAAGLQQRLPALPGHHLRSVPAAVRHCAKPVDTLLKPMRR